MTDWDDLEQLLLDLATGDLRSDGEICPSLAAYRGRAPLLLAFLRSFAKGAYHDAVLELLALALPLGADRLVFTAGGRAWSLDDPLPPVIRGVGDLRQRVLAMTVAEVTGAQVTQHSVINPFSLVGGSVTWQQSVRSQGEGWIADALTAALEGRDRFVCDPDEIRWQARRCAELGHRLAFSPEVADRLALDPDPI